MKLGKRDVPLRILISGAELDALHELTGALCESFGLDRRIESYQGKRPISLYRWDVDLLLDAVGDAVRDAEQRGTPARSTAPLQTLLARLRALHFAEPGSR